MITRHHIALTLMGTLILCSALVPASPLLMLAICTGARAGAIMPDIQMKKTRGFRIRTLAWIVTRFSRNLCIPIVCRFWHHVGGFTLDPDDKRLTHSLPGIAMLWAISAVLLIIPLSLLVSGTVPGPAAGFLGGMMTGLILHLVEDLCTRKGITPFFPFSTVKISGSIRPCDTTDRRIAQFHGYHASVAVIILGFQYLDAIQGASILTLCLFGIGTCILMMIWSSDVELLQDYPLAGQPPEPRSVQLDPVSFPGKLRYSLQGLMMGVYYYNQQ